MFVCRRDDSCEYMNRIFRGGKAHVDITCVKICLADGWGFQRLHAVRASVPESEEIQIIVFQSHLLMLWYRLNCNHAFLPNRRLHSSPNGINNTVQHRWAKTSSEIIALVENSKLSVACRAPWHILYVCNTTLSIDSPFKTTTSSPANKGDSAYSCHTMTIANKLATV